MQFLLLISNRFFCMQHDQRFCKNIALSNLSTFGIGGAVRYYYEAKNVDEMAYAVSEAVRNKVPYMVLGRGSNCLFPDDGYEGLIIHNRIDFCQIQEGHCFVGGGHSIAAIGLKTAKEGFGGLEFAAGIPGSVGGAVFMNAGCMGQATADRLVFVDILDEKGIQRRIEKKDLEYAYRSSIFQKKAWIILAAAFNLYEDRSAYERQREMVEYRLRTQPYQDRSAGCVFRNPPNMSAGQLIEKVGLKGARIGGALISPVHANFIVNFDRATAKDVLSLIRLAHDEVLRASAIDLQCEIRVI
jgi:UDP-N-acetylmuramate dehydrogenase